MRDTGKILIPPESDNPSVVTINMVVEKKTDRNKKHACLSDAEEKHACT